jgi:hypothetical protein
MWLALLPQHSTKHLNTVFAITRSYSLNADRRRRRRQALVEDGAHAFLAARVTMPTGVISCFQNLMRHCIRNFLGLCRMWNDKKRPERLSSLAWCDLLVNKIPLL